MKNKLIGFKGIFISALVLIFNFYAFAQDPNFHIYLCFGQSNMEGASQIEAQDKITENRIQVMGSVNCNTGGRSYSLGKWSVYSPSTVRCNTGLGPSDYFARTMIANMPANTKIGLVPVAIGGCDIALFDKVKYGAYVETAPDWMLGTIKLYGGNPYARLVEMAKLAQKDGVIKGILLHQGETNNGQQDWPDKVKNIYNNLITDLGLDPAQTPLLAGEMLYQNQGGACYHHNSVIAKLPTILPNSHVVSSMGLSGFDQFHFTPASYRTLGQRYAQKMLSILPEVTLPSVVFNTPTKDQVFVAGNEILLAVTASSPNGGINNVKFYNGTTLLHTDNSAPYSYAWTNAPVGTHTIKVVATDSQGNTSESVVAIKVNVPQGPYNGTRHLIPGTIQLENYDVGGNGFAYMDSSPGSSVTPTVNFRTDEDVDIENCTDVGGGYNIGFATAGEWLEYSVDVEKPGTYDLDLRVAADGTGRTVSVSMDGVNIANNVVISNTGGWQAWQSTTVKNIDLQAGKQILRVTIGATDYVNLNYVTFKLTKELKQEPYNGIAHQIPGRIQAEDYDLGGEGLAFHEANAEANEGGADYRTDEVDIEETQDIDGAYNIAYIMQGEWLEYTVNVTSDGVYDLDLRMAADGADKTLHIEMDGNDVSGAINVPNTGGWQTWQTVTVTGINLTAGEHVMRIAFDASYMNLNYVEFRDVITGNMMNVEKLVNIFPNPFYTEGITISCEGNFQFQLSEINGSIVESGTGLNTQVVGVGLNSGVFMLRILNNDKASYFKVIMNSFSQ
jgi:hypothetical protein